MRLLSFDIEDRMRILGWYQIAGGVYGFYTLIVGLFREGPLTGAKFLLYILAFLLFSFSIYCGNLLRKANIKGLSLSNWNQALQILQIRVWAISFVYFAGIRAGLGFDWDETFSTDFSISLSGISLRYNPEETSQLSIWLNIVPILVLYWIGQIENDIVERKELMESAREINEDQV